MQNPQESGLVSMLHSRRFLLISGVIILVLLAGFGIFMMLSNAKPDQSPIPEESVYIADEVVVQLAEGNEPAQPGENEEWDVLYARLQELGVVDFTPVFESDDPELSRFYKFTLKEGSDVERIRDELYKLSEIESSDPEYILHTQTSANDSEYSGMWGLQRISIENAWNITKGSESISVAVVDTGVDYTHPDFAGRTIIKGKDVSTCDSTIEEIKAAGRCTKVKQPDNDPMDTHDHGTHVAGTIGASTNNGLGIAGVNWDVTLIAVKVLGEGGAGGLSEIANGLIDAVDRGADVVNMSLGGKGTCDPQSTMQQAINYARKNGVTVVAAAGNDAVDSSGFNPASCTGVIVVGATNPGDQRSFYSNFGSVVDIAAPGGSRQYGGATSCTSANCITSTITGSGYSSLQGTSMAAPHVSGVVALMLAQNSALTPDDVQRCLIESGDVISTDRPIGGKRLNAYNALNGCTANADPPTQPPSNDVTITPPDNNSGDDTPRDYYVRGLVFNDANKNLTRDAGEVTISGVSLALSGEALRSQVTGADGEFSFLNLRPGVYLLVASVNNKSVMEYVFTLDTSMGSYNIPIPIPPQADDAGNDASSAPPARSPISGSITPTPTPRPLYRCIERTEDRQVNNKTVQLRYLDCVPK